MAGNMTDNLGMNLRSSVSDGMLNEQRCPSGDSITEWRSSEQVENGITSASAPYWDTDDDDDCGASCYPPSPPCWNTDDDDDCGPRPSDLYGRFTWRIENFSTINKRELRSNAFEIGGYKWYILIYPQGCDVCNHLSLFLCVANHDKLLPGWSHFAQFTIAVVNKDPKKSKYSDTLHRFWKKEHDWGWKKFMELSKVYDGFIVADTLVIKAQVQVIREKSDQPFRCLDGQYRRELVRVYLSNVEQICRRFLEEKIGKLSKFIEDKVRWSSFRAFWLDIDPCSRRRMSRDKTDAILKVIVKHFFIEKEVTSTLVMDSLYSGLKALKLQSKNLIGRSKSADLEELPAPVVHVNKDMFVLTDDILLLIERVVSDFLPHQPLPSKDDKCLQNRTKEGSSGDEFTKDSLDRDERRLMELGRRTIEIFVLVHIFSRIEVSYQEAIALKRQEELIREEEAAGIAENEVKSKCSASEKEKRSKKKQAKQKRNNRKGKEKGKYDKGNLVREVLQQETFEEERTSDLFYSEPVEHSIKKISAHEDASDISDTVDVAAEMLQPDLDDQAACLINWDTDTSEIHLATEDRGSDVQNGHIDKRSQSIIDDSSSTCSTDSVPSVFITGAYKGTISPINITQLSPHRGKNHWHKETHSRISSTIQTEATIVDRHSNHVSDSKTDQPESSLAESSLKTEMRQPEIQVEKVPSLQNKQMAKDQVAVERESCSNLGEKQSNSIQLPKQSPTFTSDILVSTSNNIVERTLKLSNSTAVSDKVVAPSSGSQPMLSSSLAEAQKQNALAKHSSAHQANATLRPSSAPLTAAPKSTASISPIVQAVPLLSRSVSAAGRLGTDPSPSAPSYVPQSYRNAIMGKTTSVRMACSADVNAPPGQSAVYSQSSPLQLSSPSKLPPQTPLRTDQTVIRPGLTFGCLNLEAVRGQQHLWKDSNQYKPSSSSESSSQRSGSALMDNNRETLNVYGKLQKELAGIASRSMSSQVHGTIAEEFPHLDIINDLLDDEQNFGWTARGPHHTFNRQYSLPGNLSTTSSQYDQFERYHEEGFLRSYGASGNPLRGLRDGLLQQPEFSSYSNIHGQFDGLMRNHLPYMSTDLSMHRLGDGDGNGYRYQLGDHLTRGGNGYLYRPANGP